jgi:mono/diheme cytochrome c family protein
MNHTARLQIKMPVVGLTSIDYKLDSVETNFSNHAEHYNSNSLNPSRMNMRMPAPNTVSRNKNGYLPYRLGKDSLQFAASSLVSPLDTANNKAFLAEGKILYETYCDHCHGAKGEGDGKVADKYAGVANLKGDAIKGVSEGHIFHVITMGKGSCSLMVLRLGWRIAGRLHVMLKHYRAQNKFLSRSTDQ